MTDIIQKNTLLQQLSTFLEERKDGNGNYAPVTREEIEKMFELFYAIVGLKYAEDCDGNLPIQIKIINRTRYQAMHFVPVKHLRLEAELPEVQQYLADACTNLSMAQEQVRIANIHFQFIVEDMKKK